IALGEAEQEQRAFGVAVRDQRPPAAASALAWPSHPLLNKPAAKVGVDQASFRTADGIGGVFIGDRFALSKAHNGSPFGKPHSIPRTSDYSAEYYKSKSGKAGLGVEDPRCRGAGSPERRRRVGVPAFGVPATARRHNMKNRRPARRGPLLFDSNGCASIP